MGCWVVEAAREGPVDPTAESAIPQAMDQPISAVHASPSRFGDPERIAVACDEFHPAIGLYGEGSPRSIGHARRWEPFSMSRQTLVVIR